MKLTEVEQGELRWAKHELEFYKGWWQFDKPTQVLLNIIERLTTEPEPVSVENKMKEMMKKYPYLRGSGSA